MSGIREFFFELVDGRFLSICAMHANVSSCHIWRKDDTTVAYMTPDSHAITTETMQQFTFAFIKNTFTYEELRACETKQGEFIDLLPSLPDKQRVKRYYQVAGFDMESQLVLESIRRFESIFWCHNKK